MACDSERARYFACAARNRLDRGDGSGIAWEFHHAMTQADRDNFDSWLVSIGHTLAWQPGTQWHRFEQYVRSMP